ncbi:MAG TPA: cytochrome c oxidase assembly protein [Acidimicrobiales bacterium]|jgi:putative copper resistance protein D|nr:cytochrome c oxidase assembly protein [Acidimicrobiales bacterium]
MTFPLSLPTGILADELPPPLHHGQYLTTQFEAVPLVLILGALAIYVWGVVRNNRLHPRHRWAVGKTVAFVAGLLVTAVAVFSFVGVYDDVLFWDHMVQHLLLIMVAAALFAVGSPLDLLFRATAGEAHRWVVRGLRSPVANFFGHPVVIFVAYALVIPVTHLTVFYNYTLEHEPVHNAEHLVFLGVGYLFWRQIFGSDPNRYRMHPGMKMLYLFLAVPIDTFVGLSLDSESHEIFTAYSSMHRTWGPSLVMDLHIGGVIMWVGGDTLMMAALIPVALQWLHLEERKAVRVDRELDAMLPDRGPGGPDPVDLSAPR